MSMLQSHNPVLTKGVKALDWDLADSSAASSAAATFSVGGAAAKTLVLLALTVGAATISWDWLSKGEFNPIWLIGGSIGGLIVAFATFWKPAIAPYTGPLYAGLMGIVLGALTALAETRFPGVATQAVACTFGVFFVMLALYTSRTIRVTPGFAKFLAAAVFGIMVTYLVSIALSFFGVSVPFLHQPNPIGIGIAVFITAIAALTLLLDFKQIEELAAAGAPKQMEWYAAFGLMVGLIWLYIEILRLLQLIAAYSSGD